jgi:hypothetical protein
MTHRGLIIGATISALLGALIPYSDLVMRGTWIGLTSFPIASFFPLLVISLLNPLLPNPLSKGEILTIYSMALVSAGIPSFGLTGLLIPYIAGPFYFASPENRFSELLHPYLPSWLFPRLKESVIWLYEGLPHGIPIPWSTWILPLLSWTALAICVYLVFFCICYIFRRQWIENEKLAFPIVQLPIKLADAMEKAKILKDRKLWLFALLPITIHTLNGLHFHWPFMPYINVHLIPLDRYFTERPWDAVTPFWIRILFSIIGLTFLIPLDVSFSLWFFYFFFLAQQVLASAIGYPMKFVQAYPVREFVAHQMIGGITVFGLYMAWNARNEIRRRWGSEYRKPVMIMGIGILSISLWGWISGAGFLHSLLLFLLYFLFQLVGTRLVCEGGMLYVQHPYRPFNIFLSALGTRPLGPRKIAMLSLFDHLFMLDNRSPLMPEVMQGLKMGNEAGIKASSILFAMAISVLVVIPISYWSYIRLMYSHGGLTLHPWFTTYYTQNLYCTWTSHLIRDGEPATPGAFLWIAIGGATMWLLMFAYRNFLWWPLNPIGYMMGASWPMINFWFSLFCGWAIKLLVLRYGGAKLYRSLIPPFLGLILGEFGMAGIWLIVDLITGVKGHEIFSF